MQKVSDKNFGIGGGTASFQSRNQMSSLAFIKEVEFYMRQRTAQTLAKSCLSSQQNDLSIEVTVNHSLLETLDDYSFYDSAHLASLSIRSS
jgi:hypothetical protein